MKDIVARDPMSALGVGCRILDLDQKLKKSLLKNHTQFFTCSRFKYHPIHNHAETVNRGVQSIGKHALQHRAVKFYPHHSKDTNLQLRMLDMNPTNNPSLVYANPYFWSHLTVSPCGPIVQTEYNLFVTDRIVRAGLDHPIKDEQPKAEAKDLVAESSHQLCMLRRLVYCINARGVELIRTVMKNMPNATFVFRSSIDTQEARISMTASTFQEQLVSNLKMTNWTADGVRKHQLALPFIMPAVVSPADLRYCVYIDPITDAGHNYVPALGRNYPQLPRCSEFDILSMNRLQFLWLWYHSAIEGPDRVVPFDVSSLVKKKYVTGASAFGGINLTHSLASCSPPIAAMGGSNAYPWTLLDPSAPSDAQGQWMYNEIELCLDRSSVINSACGSEKPSREFEKALTRTPFLPVKHSRIISGVYSVSYAVKKLRRW